MNINRNNYEEYFLLYVDNELSAAERNMVEAFVAANADLQEELLMLQQSTARPDAVEFAGKEKLLKPEAVDAATEEKLLLLLDGELKGTEKENLILLINTDNSIQKEWELLLQTKLPVSKIIFENKASLYKKEESKVVPIKWWRAAAAAMLIGFGLWGAVSYLNKSEKVAGKTETAKTPLPAGRNTGNSIAAPAVKNEKPVVEKERETGAVAKNIEKKKTVEEIKITAPKVEKPFLPKQEETINNIVLEKQSNDMPEPANENINEPESNKNTTASVPVEKETNKVENSNQNQDAPANTLASNTPAKEYNTFEEDDGNDNRRRSKIGSFFKRAKRVIERKTKIKTGSSDEVRIANMSFAMK